MATEENWGEAVDFQLNRFKVGGPVGIGLEAQGDLGLLEDKYVRVPESLKHGVAVVVDDIIVGDPCPYGGVWEIDVLAPPPEKFILTHLYYHRGRYWVFLPVPTAVVPTGSYNRAITGATNPLDELEAEDFEPTHTAYCAAQIAVARADRGEKLPPSQPGSLQAYCQCPEGSAEKSLLVHFKELRRNDFRAVKTNFLGTPDTECIHLPFPVDQVKRISPNVTMKDIAMFAHANMPAYGTHKNAVTGVAGRLLAYMLGLMSSKDEKELVFFPVADAEMSSMRVAKEISGLIKQDHFCSEVLTMAAARTVSYRQTGHCTGGTIATGYVQKVLEQSNWVEDKNKVSRADTDLFYLTFHAVGNRNMMVLLCPRRYETTACFVVEAGIPIEKTAEASVKLRLEPSSGVAGTKLLIDSRSVIMCAINEGTIVTFPTTEGIKQLFTNCDIVRSNGLLTGTAARFWARDNPFGMRPHPIDQHASNVAAICQAAATYCIAYMQGSTLAKAKSLQACAKQNSDAALKAMWIELRKKSVGMKVGDAVTLIHTIQKRRGMVKCADFMSPSEEARRTAAYHMQELLKSLNVSPEVCAQYLPLSQAEVDAASLAQKELEEIEARIEMAAQAATS